MPWKVLSQVILIKSTSPLLVHGAEHKSNASVSLLCIKRAELSMGCVLGQFDLQVYLKLGPIRVVIPVHVSDVQFKVLSRVMLHLVDTFPCMGGATVSLLEVPHFDFKLQLFGCPVDLMSLPGVKWAVRYATQVCFVYFFHIANLQQTKV